MASNKVGWPAKRGGVVPPFQFADARPARRGNTRPPEGATHRRAFRAGRSSSEGYPLVATHLVVAAYAAQRPEVASKGPWVHIFSIGWNSRMHVARARVPVRTWLPAGGCRPDRSNLPRWLPSHGTSPLCARAPFAHLKRSSTPPDHQLEVGGCATRGPGRGASYGKVSERKVVVEECSTEGIHGSRQSPVGGT